MRTLVFCLGAAALLTACASGPERGEADRGPHAGPQVFVSPFGEVFTAAPGEAYPVVAWFEGADANHDGALTLDEFAADGVRWFRVLDLDRNGRLSPAEIAAFEARSDQALSSVAPRGRRGGPRLEGRGEGLEDDRDHGEPSFLADGGQQDRGGRGGPSGRGGGPGGMGGRSGAPGGAVSSSAMAMASLLNVPEPVKSADLNFNQTVTPEEWRATTERWFSLLDVNKDGRLTLAELPQTALQQNGPGRRRGPR